MTVRSAALETTLDAIRERAIRLEQEAVALRADLDEVAILLSWEADHSISPAALQKVAVSDAELSDYRRMMDGQFPDAVLRLILQAQKAATRLKQSLRAEEREAAIGAVINSLKQAAASLGLTIPVELEVVIGD